MKGKRIVLSLVCVGLLAGIVSVIFYGEHVRKNNAEKINQSVMRSSEKASKDGNINPTKDNQKSTEETTKPKVRFEGLKLTKESYGIPVFRYDGVEAAGAAGTSNTSLSQDKLREEFKYLSDKGYAPITLTELYGYLKEDKAIPEKAVVLTFDGGSSNFYQNAFPVLKEFNFLASVFISSDVIGNNTYLTKDQLKELSDYGIEIGEYAPKDMSLNTMKKAKDTIGAITNKPVDSIAYPNSISLKTRKTIESSGYKMAFNATGFLTSKEDNIYNLDRIKVDNKTSIDDFVKSLTAKGK